MVLPPKDAVLFFQLLFKLQYYVNEKYKIVQDISSIEEFIPLSSQVKLPVRDRLWANTDLIDAYIGDNPDQLPREQLQIIRSWKQAVVGDFFIERMGKRQAIFIHGNDVYAVIGLTDELDEIFHPSMLPLRVRGVLLPFKGQIVYDGLLQSYRVIFGGGIKGELKETYLAAKQNRRVITSFGESAYAQVGDESITLPDNGPTITELQKMARKLRGSKDAPAVWTPSFKLAQAALELAAAAIHAPDDVAELWVKYDKVVKSAKRMENILMRADR